MKLNDSFVGSLVGELSRKSDEALQEQLSEYIRRGIIHIEYTGPTLVELPGGTYKVVQSVRLVPTEIEYIRKLEAEIKEYREVLGSCLITQKCSDVLNKFEPRGTK